VAKRQGRVWALPKGRLNEGESVDQTALREILEETGHKAEIIDLLDEISYVFFLKESGTLYHKKVTFFLMKLIQENAQERDQENDFVNWVDMGEAIKKLSYINEKKVLKRAQGLMH
jgi:8-oxo-dGTP pyrophosphatase MutT (NUDIX family)